MKAFAKLGFIFCFASLFIPSPGLTGKGYMGGQGNIVVENPPPSATTETVVTEQTPTLPTSTSGVPDTVSGPLNDKMADAGKLFGDLYKILRHKGTPGDKKLIPAVDSEGVPILTNGIQLFTVATNSGQIPEPVIGGEPILTVVDAETYPSSPTSFSDYGWYSVEVIKPDGTSQYVAAQSPYPAQCVQPVADYERWGDIKAKTGLTKNRLPMVITYDATWGRSECNVGQVSGTVVADPVTGDLTIPTDYYFIEPCPVVNGVVITSDQGCQWSDPKNGTVTYPTGVLWTELVGEVHFGRLNLSRSPEAVLQAAFDEVINTLNSSDTVAIKIDAAGRLLLTKNVYDEFLVDPATGLPQWIGTVEKAIDSPLENVALYVKLMQDGHLVTPADERIPIDRSKNGGIPLWKMLELTDGPASAVLRPTVDLVRMGGGAPKVSLDPRIGVLFDVAAVSYLTYYQCLDANGLITPCLCWNEDPVQPELDRVLETCPNVTSRALFSTTTGTCPPPINADNPIVCEGPFVGIETDGDYAPNADDLKFASAFLAAAADKTGDFNVDMVVYLNSILGINKVLGYSSYADDGSPAPDAINYSKNPQYFNFNLISGYNRQTTFDGRGDMGNIYVLQGGPTSWTVTYTNIMTAQMDGASIFDDLGLDGNWFPDRNVATENILGFTQQVDDNLGVIKFTHTFQIPGLR